MITNLSKIIFILILLFFALLPLWAVSTQAVSNLLIETSGSKLKPSQNPCKNPGMVFVPAGEFIMGSDKTEKEFAYNLDGGTTRKYGWYDIEVKIRINLSGYCMNKTPVTNKDYSEFVNETNHRFPYISQEDYQKQGFLVHPYKKVLPFLWDEKGYPEGLGKHPVVLVSVNDAEEYCHWRGIRNNNEYYLPTEKEREKAARGTNGNYFPWGNQWDPKKLNSLEAGPYFTTEVGSYHTGQSPFGMLDAAGNVFEWTSSTLSNGKFILKGCSWDDSPGICRPAARHGRLSQSRHILIGFRCAANK